MPPSGPGRPTSASPGSRKLLTRTRLVELTRRHGVTPRKALGQHFLADPNLARAIAREVGAAPGRRILEVGAGLGSLTLALAQAGARVLALEVDPGLLRGLEEVVGGLRGMTIERVDAMKADWGALLGRGRWRMASNLPYNVAVPIVLDLLEQAPRVDPMLVMVQREVGERLAASPGDPAFGAPTLRVAFRARAIVVRRVPPTVFWPAPKVESVLVRLERRPPPVRAPEGPLFRLIDEGFGQRRKTLANALVRLGYERGRADEALRRAGLTPRVRAEEVGLEGFARLLEALDG